ncbi:MAG: PDZ domain-containing protein [Candidatus Nealsonbacteria bacterium]|nr:PDZ domain-containing protein [Candidatus Nealsonbacteria bacterium]
MGKAIKKIILVLVALIFIFLIFFGGFLFGQMNAEPKVIFGVSNPELGQPLGVDFSLFWQAWAVIESKFVNKDKMDFTKMVYGAISGMVNALGDPYTVFFPPEESKKFFEDVTGSFEGVGMEIDIKKGQLQVVSPLEESPAQKAGIRAGDKILKINGTSTEGLTIDEAVKFIRGPKGTEIVLTILRDEWEDSQEIKIVRSVIQVPSLKLEFKEVEGERVAYLKLYQFSEKASLDFRRAAVEILNSSANKIVLDLRNNPGGYLEVAQDIAGWFLAKGQTVTVEDFGGKREQNFYKAEGNGALLSYPIVILINEGSASASEILAGALRDNRQVMLIGQKSFGKGSVQELETLGQGSSLKVTVAKWLTPKGDFITEVGLEPDFKVEITEDDVKNEKDPQLEKALEVIGELK